CGKTGCVETVISGPALEEFYRTESNTVLPLKQIFERLEVDPAAKQTQERLLHYLGRGLAEVINIVDPEKIVLGGGISNLEFLYSELNQRILPFLFNPTLETPILKNQLGDSAGVFGAALL